MALAVEGHKLRTVPWLAVALALGVDMLATSPTETGRAYQALSMGGHLDGGLACGCVTGWSGRCHAIAPTYT